MEGRSMSVDGSKNEIDRVRDVTSGLRGGVYKRIDQNRELLEELRTYASELLERRPWIEEMLKQHDEFFCGLAEAIPPVKAHYMPFAGLGRPFPRPWINSLQDQRAPASAPVQAGEIFHIKTLIDDTGGA
jgi:hypothetical protein